MQGKVDMGTLLTPLFHKNGMVGSIRIYKYRMENFSGWVLRRGDHKSPLPHSYSSLKVTGAGVYRYQSTTNASDGGFSRLGSAYPSGYIAECPSWMYNETLDKLYGKMRGDLDLSVDAFQARQTARGFKAGDLVTQFGRDMRKNPKIRPFMRKAYAIARLAGSLRLAWVYGWRPLIGDYYAVLDEALRDYINKYQTLSAVRNFTTSGVCTGYVESGSRNLAPYKCQTHCSVKVSITLDTTNMPSLAHWTSLNPASIGWELLPFSFVFDWFADVGSTLRSIETALLYNRAFKSGYVTRFTRTTGESSGGVSQPSNIVYMASGHFAFTYVNVSRTVLSSMPFPDRHILRPKLGTDRLLNGLALLVGLKTKR